MNDKSSLLEKLRIERAVTPTSTGPTRLWVLLGAGAVLAGLVVVWLVFSGPGRIPVQAVIAKGITAEGPTVGGSLLDASGYVIPRLQATVSSNIVARVISVPIEEGQHVRKGQLLAQLDDANYNAALQQTKAMAKQAQAALSAAQEALADAEPIYRRATTQLAQELISQEAFDIDKANYDIQRNAVNIAQQNLAAAQAAVGIAQSNEDYTRIYALFDGVITTITAHPGEIVSYSFSGGGGIATLVDMDSLEVQVDVSENFINRVRSKQPAVITLNAYPDWRIPAEVIAVIPTADQAKATVKVRVAFKERDDRVLPQMGARVSFLTNAAASQKGAAPASPGVIVPTEAVQTNGDIGTVFLIRSNALEKRTVRLGARTSDGQIILSGVGPGDRLATGNLAQLSDKMNVRIEEPPKP